MLNSALRGSRDLIYKMQKNERLRPSSDLVLTWAAGPGLDVDLIAVFPNCATEYINPVISHPGRA